VHGGGPERLTAAERLRIDEGRSFAALFDGAADVRPLAWRLPQAKCELLYTEGNPNPWCRCTATIPAVVDAVMEGIWEINSEAMRYDDNVEYRVLCRPSVRSVEWVFRVRIVPLLPAFEFRLSGTWARSAGGSQNEFSIVFLPSLGQGESSLSSESHAACTRILLLLSPGARANTTDVTYVFQLDFGSHGTTLEKFLPNVRVQAVRWHRVIVVSFRRCFQKQLQAWLNDVEDDGSWREAMVTEMREREHSYTAEEIVLIAEGSALLGTFAASQGKARLLRHSKTIEVAHSKFDPKTRLLIGQVEALVPGASADQLVAYMMHFGSKHNLSKRSHEDYQRWEILEVKSTHCTVALFETKVSPGFRNRTFLFALLWKKVADAPLTFIWVQVPMKRHDKFFSSKDDARAVRARCTRCLRATRISADVSRIEYVCAIDAEGHFVTRVEDILLSKLMRLPYALQVYFLQIKSPNMVTSADAAFIGHMLVDVAEVETKHQRASAIKTFAERTAVLRESGVSSLGVLLASTLGESFDSVLPPAVAAKNPATLTVFEAKAIGCGFEAIIRVCADPYEAVDDFLHAYHALDAAAQRHDWLRPMLETIAKRRVAKALLGLKLRLAIGAALSIGDMVSDIMQIVRMFLAAQTVPAVALIAMLLANLAFQSLLVIMQTAHRGWQVAVWELFIVFSLLKPGIDAIRVAGGEERVGGAPLDPFMEMILCKVSELTFESIPGGLTQAVFLLNGGDWSTAVLVSVGLSCLSTAFTATTLTYELDTNVVRRRRNPKFYGYIPDETAGRLRAFIFLFLYHSTHTMGKTYSMALLWQTNWLWLVVYLLVDHCVLILYKLARGDLIYWIPGLGVPLSVLSRFIVKVVTDFTGSAPGLTRPDAHCARSIGSAMPQVCPLP
jgi:hypothetical protein